MTSGSRSGLETGTTHRLRITIVVASTRARGAEIAASQLRDQLARSGHVCRLIALVRSDAASTISASALADSPLSARALRGLRAAARDADVVVAYGSSTLPACALALSGTGVPFVYRSIGDPSRWITGPVHQRRTGALFRRAAHVVALWDAAGADIVDLYRVDPARVSAIPNARDPGQFRPPSRLERSESRTYLGVPPEASAVVAIGALEPEKRFELAVRTVALLPDVHLYVAGDGSQRRQLEELARDLAPGRIHFLGHVADPTVVLHAADALLLTSTTEGMPGVVLEAGLCGVPAVATRVGMLDQMVIDGETGLVVERASAETMSAALQHVIKNHSELGRAARTQLADRFGWDHVLPAWSDLLVEVAAGRRRSRPPIASDTTEL